MQLSWDALCHWSHVSSFPKSELRYDEISLHYITLHRYQRFWMMCTPQMFVPWARRIQCPLRAPLHWWPASWGSTILNRRPAQGPWTSAEHTLRYSDYCTTIQLYSPSSLVKGALSHFAEKVQRLFLTRMSTFINGGLSLKNKVRLLQIKLYNWYSKYWLN